MICNSYGIDDIQGSALIYLVFYDILIQGGDIMEAKLMKTIQIPVSQCDNEGKLSIPSIFSIFMDMATFHAAELGVGLDKLGPKGLFWLTVKTKIKIIKRPAMLETVNAITWPQKPNRIRFNRFYTLNSNDEMLIEGKTEWAIIDTNSGKLQRAEDVYPDSIMHSEDTVCNTPFEKFNIDFLNAECIGKYTVKSTDIDIGNHMNNAAYIRAFFGFISCDELANMEPKEIEIAFKSPCFEKETLDVKRITEGKNLYLAFIHKDNSVASTIKFSY